MKKNQRLPRTRDRALSVYQWVRTFQREHRYQPSMQEVADGLQIVPSHVKHIRDAMVEMNLMYPVPARVERAWPLRPIPKNFAGDLGSLGNLSPE